MASNLPPQMLLESFGTVVYTLDSGIFFSRFTPLDPPRSVQTGPPLVGCSHSLRTDVLVFKEVDGLCPELHYCTPGLVRTSAESTPYKGYYYYYYYSRMTRRNPGRNISRITYKNSHKSLRRGIILLFVSEVLFLVSFFWAFFHTRLSPTNELGSTWPLTGIQLFNPVQVPLLNKVILLAPGVTVIRARHDLLEK